MVTLTINGTPVKVAKTATILEAAKKVGIAIPTLCNHPDLPPSGTCGMCVVSVAGREGTVRSCATTVEEGMEVMTDTPELTEERKGNLEALLGHHVLECDDCVFLQKCHLLELVREYGAKPTGKKQETDRVSPFRDDRLRSDEMYWMRKLHEGLPDGVSVDRSFHWKTEVVRRPGCGVYQLRTVHHALSGGCHRRCRGIRGA